MKAIGVDVAKDSLQIWIEGVEVFMGNDKKEIRKFLRALPQEYAIGLESTNSYWWTLVRLACEMGFAEYAVDVVGLKAYRESFPGRGKTDKRDAEVIARYVEREHDKLRRYVPVPEHLRALVNVFRRRMKVVRAKVALSASFTNVKECKGRSKSVPLGRSNGEPLGWRQAVLSRFRSTETRGPREQPTGQPSQCCHRFSRLVFMPLTI